MALPSPLLSSINASWLWKTRSILQVLPCGMAAHHAKSVPEWLGCGTVAEPRW